MVIVTKRHLKITIWSLEPLSKLKKIELSQLIFIEYLIILNLYIYIYKTMQGDIMHVSKI